MYWQNCDNVENVGAIVWKIKIKMIGIDWCEKEEGLGVQFNQKTVINCGWNRN